MFVFAGWKDNLGNNLSYANAKMATIHVNNDDDAGHELSHILCKETFAINSIFIDEGLAEFFDGLIRGYKIVPLASPPTLNDLFRNFRSYDQDYSYLYARVFISCVFEFYNGNIQAARRTLEVSSIEQLHKNSCDALRQITTNTEKVFAHLVAIKRRASYVYVGRSDLFNLENI